MLFRAAHHSGDLEMELARRRIPYVKYGGLRYLEAAHVKDLLAAFRLAITPAMRCPGSACSNSCPASVPPRLVASSTASGDDEHVLPLSFEVIAQRWPRYATCCPTTCGVLDPLVDAMSARRGEPVVFQAERIRDAMTPLIVAAYDDAAPRLEDLGALVVACADAVRLSDVAADQALDAPVSTGDLAGPPMVDEDWLVLSTVHSAKGLEFDAVHVIHAADGNFPSDMALGSREDSKRNVGCSTSSVTRARRDLSIYVPLRYHHHVCATTTRGPNPHDS